MRLAQLARKLSKKPSEITEFLASKDIQIENSSNAKVEDAHVEMVLEQFGETHNEAGIEGEYTQAEELNVDDHIESEEIAQPIEDDVPQDGVEQDADEEIVPSVPIEVIKAPKVELAGLKVVGKIDLPEPKKKLVEEPAAGDEEQTGSPEKEQRHVRKPRHAGRNHRDSGDRRPQKTPLVLQREREEREARRKRKEEEKKKKELRTKRYLSKVKPAAELKPPKKKKRVEDVYTSGVSQSDESKGFFRKIVSWLTAH